MPLNPTVSYVQQLFQPLNDDAATFPSRKALSSELHKFIKPRHSSHQNFSINVNNDTVKKFGSAAVEMWHRAIHSYLTSASLTKTSPLWASVSGYYSSHYTVRAFAHILGYFQLFKDKKIVHLDLSNFTCDYSKKNGNEREHKFYWQVVNNNPLFKTNPFFTNNEEEHSTTFGELVSDSGHRSIANYADHINNFPTFNVLNEADLISRLEKISGLDLSDAPIPRIERYPDLDNVQVIAFQRLVAFRGFLDETIGTTNRFWKRHRNPSWVPDYFDFQFIKPEYITIYKSA